MSSYLCRFGDEYFVFNSEGPNRHVLYLEATVCSNDTTPDFVDCVYMEDTKIALRILIW